MPKVTHFEIYADDPKRAIKFYKNVFGWEAKKWDGPMDYWMITTGSDKEPGINGAVMERPEPNKCDDAVTTFMCWITVPSIDQFTKKIVSNGGTITMPKTAIPGMGWNLKFMDTEGNNAGLMEMDKNAE